jgi:glycosyltransferase involved in cell wall biosynthesis
MREETLLAADTAAALPSQRGSGPIASDCEAARGRNILIVGINYAPESTGIGPYTTATAEHVARTAASVTVLTGLPSYPEWQVQPEYRGRRQFRETCNGVDVQRLWHTVPRRQDAARRGLYEASFLAHAASRRLSRRPDLVIGVTPALAGAVAAAHLADRYDAPLVLVVQDVLGAAATQSGIAGGGRVAEVVARAEGRTLRRASEVIIVADSFQTPLRQYGIDKDRLHTIPNWSRLPSPRRDRDAERRRLGWSDATIVLHSGNMGLKQGLEVVVEAARLTRDQRNLRWVLMGDGSQRSALQRLGADLPNLDFLPLCATEDYPEVLAAADVLLLCERPGVLDMSLPSKLTSYFTSGLPVVSAVSPGGSTARELGRAGAPAPTEPGNAPALVEQVLALRRDPQRRARHAAAGARHASQNLTFAAAVGRLDAVLSKAVDVASASRSAQAVTSDRRAC